MPFRAPDKERQTEVAHTIHDRENTIVDVIIPLERQRSRRQQPTGNDDAIELAKLYDTFDKLSEESAGTKDLKAKFELEKKMAATANEIVMLGFVAGLSPGEQQRWAQLMSTHLHIAADIDYRLSHGANVIPLSMQRR